MTLKKEEEEEEEKRKMMMILITSNLTIYRCVHLSFRWHA